MKIRYSQGEKISLIRRPEKHSRLSKLNTYEKADICNSHYDRVNINCKVTEY